MKRSPAGFLFFHPGSKGLFLFTRRALIDASECCYTVFLGRKTAYQGNIYTPVKSGIAGNGLYEAPNTPHNASDNSFLLDFPFNLVPLTVQLLIRLVNLAGIFIRHLSTVNHISAPFYDLEKLAISFLKCVIDCLFCLFAFGTHLCLFIVVPVNGEFRQIRPCKEIRIWIIFTYFLEKCFYISVELVLKINFPVFPYSRNIHKDVDNQCNCYHYGNDFFDEKPCPFKAASQDTSYRRHVISRHLENKRGGLRFSQHRETQDFRYREGYDNSNRRDEKHDNSFVGSEEHTHKKHIERDFGQTIHEGTDQYGCQLCPLILYGAACHYAGYCAPAYKDPAQYHRKCRLAMQAKISENTVQDKRNPGHIARILHDGY